MRLLDKPIKMPLTIYQGATFERSWQWMYRPIADAPPVPVPLANCTGRGEIRKTWKSPEVLAVFSVAESTLMLDTVQSIIRITLLPVKTKLLIPTVEDSVWNFNIYWPDGHATRLFEGNVTTSAGMPP